MRKCCFVFCFLLFAGVISPFVSGQPLESLLPENTLLSFYFCGASSWEKQQQPEWQEVFKSQEFQDAKKMLGDMGEAVWARLPLAEIQKSDYKPEEYLKILQSDCIVGVREPNRGEPDVMIVFGQGKEVQEKIRTGLTKFLGMTSKRSSVPIKGQKPIDMEEFQVKGKSTLFAWTWKGCYLLATRKASVSDILSMQKSLVENANFKKLREMNGVAKNILLSAYWNIELAVQKTSTPNDIKAMDVLGVKNWKGLMWSLSGGKLLQNNFALLAPGEKKGLTQLLSFSGGSPEKLLPHVPCAFSQFTYIPLDPQKVFCFFKDSFSALESAKYRQFEESMKSWQEQSRLDIAADILDPFAGDFLFFTPAPQELAGTSFGLIRLRDVAKFQNIVSRLEESGLILKKNTDYKGKAICYFVLPPGNLMERIQSRQYEPSPAALIQYCLNYYLGMNSCFLIEGDTLILSGLVQNLKDYVDYKEAHAEAKVPLPFNISGETGITVWDNGVTGNLYVYNTMLPVFSFLEGAVREFGLPFDVSRFPKASGLRPLFGPSTFQWGSHSDGIKITSQFTIGNMAPTAGFVAGSGIMAALLLPALSAVQDKAMQMKCKVNLSRIGKAVMLYREDFGKGKKYPPLKNPDFFTTLYETKILIEPEVFISPISGHKPGTAADFKQKRPEVTDYEVRTAPITSPFKDTTLQYLAWTKEGIHATGRNVLFLDGHVEFIPEEEFAKEVKKYIAK
jgi:prepilin-type processing-associated H-X9-DG protein